jgi:signal transduction histidine kinase
MRVFIALLSILCLVYAYPSFAQNKALLPALILKSTRVENDSLHKPAKSLSLGAQEDEILLEFEPIQADEPIIYCFQLSPLENRIVKSPYPTIRYTGLKGDQYNLQYFYIKGNQLSADQNISIKVKKSLMETWWFLPMMVTYLALIVGGVVYFWTIYNLRQKIKLEGVRNRIASDLHDEIGSSLSSLAFDLKTIQKTMSEGPLNGQQKAMEDMVGELRFNAEETIGNLRDTVWTIQTDNDDFLKLLERMRNAAIKLLRNREIEFQFDNRLQEEDNFKINMEQRRNVYLIFKEAIHNCIKHAKAKQVKVAVFKHQDYIKMTIDDDGQGFDMAQAYEGNGLKIFNRRAEESFIVFDQKSEIGRGTSISLLIPKL